MLTSATGLSESVVISADGAEDRRRQTHTILDVQVYEPTFISSLLENQAQFRAQVAATFPVRSLAPVSSSPVKSRVQLPELVAALFAARPQVSVSVICPARFPVRLP